MRLVAAPNGDLSFAAEARPRQEARCLRLTVDEGLSGTSKSTKPTPREVFFLSNCFRLDHHSDRSRDPSSTRSP